MPRSRSRGCRRIRCACARWQASWYAALTGSSCRSARGPPSRSYSSARNSLKSRTRPLNAAARPASASAPGLGLVLAARAKNPPNSFMAEPHPAELTTIVSTPARSNSAIARSANLAASAARPECSDSAPQQPWPGGTITSQPSVASTRAVAALTPAKKTCCTQPVSMPTTARRSDPGREPGLPGSRLGGEPQRPGELGGVPGRGAALDQAVEPGPLGNAERAGQGAEPLRVGERGEDRGAHGPVAERPGRARWLLALLSHGADLFRPATGGLD